jgi:hypothetical protein
MSKTVQTIIAVVIGLHGLIHLMGFANYLKLGEIEGLPYKTNLLGGRWELGEGGIKIFGVLWLLAAVGFVVAAFALATQQAWASPMLLVVTIFSFLITGLDYQVAFAGIGINIAILLALWLVPGM